MSCHFGKSCPLGSFTPWENLVQMWFVFTSPPWLRKAFRSSSYCAHAIFLLPTCQPCPEAPHVSHLFLGKSNHSEQLRKCLRSSPEHGQQI